MTRLDNPLETNRRDVYGGDAAYLILDELQTIDGWVKSLYDQNRQSAPHWSGEVNAVHR